MEVKQYQVYLINFDPTIGYEIKKSRPCVIISPDQMNKYISTIIIAPMTTKSHKYPTRIPIEFQNKNGFVILDQIRTIDKKRVVKKLGQIQKETIDKIKLTIKEMLVD
ncbi:MAG: type II toxin-antitoxin system PemK/MazF family toxin [bacterium]